MASTQPPLDEILHTRPDIVEWWVGMGGRPMDENMIHRYMSESPFFDYTSNNGLVLDQSRTVQQAFDLSCNRRAFEDDLRKKRGLEFMIVGDPQALDGSGRRVEGGVGGNGMWVVRKQEREGARGGEGETTTLGTYYLVGENMYQAPGVGDILGNRLVSAANNLSKFFDQAAGLADFSPTTGYSYLAAANKKSPTTTAVSASGHASPARSRECSVVPNAETQSLRSGSLLPDSGSQAGGSQQQSTTAPDSRLLAQSFQMSLEFSDEYTDENPLIGEPGHFSFTHSTAAVKKRRADEEATLAAAKLKQEKLTASSRVATPTVKAAAAPSPPAVMTAASAVAKADKGEKEGRRGSKMERVKRKKSKAGNALGTPTTPVGGGGSAGIGSAPATG
ncbi:Mediator of RNA polymerase II transcription subunit 6 [Vermiconidia calcicola]|uniref:Mediator of RNA polymerase II transcription subunit 6 n=1 Tax=Vermiconidia calcicola TaxID=1690605 RepID=A0ACC3MFE8_9PEZI|nr:Mediator of RNA polymerase II transcription subunit 6 [Vermiconidia calcicola]